jgi:16S rRNA (adenine1518-N6/adenine1519-N6)-dimethyltransferase
VTNLRDVLEERKFHPSKRLGQNFLVDETYLRKIVEAAELTSEDLVLEIGPGTGNLTAYLVAAAGHVLAIELDERLVEALRERFSPDDELTIAHGDILEIDLPGLLKPWLERFPRYKVVANLPYYLTSAAIRLLLESATRPSLAVLTVQWEVAQRICEKPGDMSLLAVAVQWYAVPQVISRVPAGAFSPVPQVDSAVLRLDLRAQPPAEVPDERALFRVVRAGFSQRRKQLRNALSAGLRIAPAQVETIMLDAGVDPKRRAETLSLDEWAALVRTFAQAHL